MASATLSATTGDAILDAETPNSGGVTEFMKVAALAQAHT